MPIVPASEVDSPVTDSLLLHDQRLDTPVQDAQGGEYGDGWFQNLADNAQTNLFIGSGFFRVARLLEENGYDERDPAFDPWALYNNNEYFESHPWMVKPFADGVVDNVPNKERYAIIEGFAKQEYDTVQRMGRHGMAMNLTNGLALGLLEGIALTPAAKLAGAAGVPTSQVAAWMKRGGAFSRAAKAMAAGSVANLTQERLLYAMNPGRYIGEQSEDEVALDSVVYGALGGLIIHGAMEGLNKFVRGTPNADIKRASGEGADILASDHKGDLEAMADTELDGVEKTLREKFGPPAPSELDKLLQTPGTPRPGLLNDLLTQPRPRGDAPGQIMESPSAMDALLGRTGDAQLTGRELEQALLDARNPRSPLQDLLTGDVKPRPAADNGVVSVKSAATEAPAAKPTEPVLPKAAETARADRVAELRKPSESTPPGGGTVNLEYNPATGKMEEVGRGLAMGAASRAEFAGAYPLSEAGQRRQAALSSLPSVHDIMVLRTEKNAARIDQIKNQYGDRVNFIEHPNQAVYDSLQSAEGLTNRKLGPIKDKVLYWMEGAGPMAQPAIKLARSGSSAARAVARFMFHYARPTQDAFDDPLHFSNYTSMSGHLMQLDVLRDKTFAAHHQAGKSVGRSGGFTYTMMDGSDVKFRNMMLDHRLWGDIVGDYMLRERSRSGAQATSAAMASQGVKQFDVPAEVKQAAEAWRHYYNKMGVDLHEVNLFKRGVDEDQYYLTRQWKSQDIKLNREDFVRRGVVNQRKLYQYDPATGKERQRTDRAVDPEVLKYESRPNRGLSSEDKKIINDLAQAATPEGKAIDWEKFTEDMLPDDLYQKYLDEIDIRHEKRAATLFESITEASNSHGVEDAFTNPKVTRERFEIYDHADFAPYLNLNAADLGRNYHFKVAGDLASRKAIKGGNGLWESLSARILNEDLAKKAYDPESLYRIAEKDYQKLINEAVRVGDTKLAEKLRVESNSMLKLLKGQLESVRGKHAPQIDNDFVNFAFKLTNDFVDMAGLGMSSIANWADVARSVLHQHWNGDMLKSLGKVLTVIKDVDASELEGFAVALDDHARELLHGDWSDVFTKTPNEPYGSGRAGKLMAKISRGSDKLKDLFFRVTGLEKVNMNQRRFWGKAAWVNIVEGVRKMERVRRDVANGMDEAAAMAKHNLGKEEAARLANLGINADEARRIANVLDQYGTDMQGNPLTSKFVDSTGPVDPNAGLWAGHAFHKNLASKISDAINNHAATNMIEPRHGYNFNISRTPGGLLLNKFTSFMHTWGSRGMYDLMTAHPGRAFAYVMASIGTTALANIIRDYLAGRRTIDQSMQAWSKHPERELYRSAATGPLFGWMSRFIGFADSAGVGPGSWLGTEDRSSAYGRRANGDVFQMHPVTAYMGNVYKAMMAGVPETDADKRRIFRILPYGNIWWLRLAGRWAEQAGYRDVPFLPPRAR